MMRITLIHGQNHQGSTYHIARLVAEKLGGETEEFFLPRDFSGQCTGCKLCLDRSREHCPHYGQAGPILRSMLEADVIMIGSPTYVLEMTGQLKSLFDHLFTAWLPHRPEEAMFSKTAVVVSTAAGAGMKGVTKSLARQMFYLGVPKVHQIAQKVAATSWEGVGAKTKKQIDKKTDKIALKIIRKNAKSKPGLKLKSMFLIMRKMQQGNDWAPADRAYWEEHGWLGKARPWK